MLHTMQTRVVTRKYCFTNLIEVHKVYYFCPSMLTAQGIKDIDAYIDTKINQDIQKFIQENSDYTSWSFEINNPQNVPTQYIG